MVQSQTQKQNSLTLHVKRHKSELQGCTSNVEFRANADALNSAFDVAILVGLESLAHSDGRTPTLSGARIRRIIVKKGMMQSSFKFEWGRVLIRVCDVAGHLSTGTESQLDR